jgi:hypothetical protein
MRSSVFNAVLLFCGAIYAQNGSLRVIVQDSGTEAPIANAELKLSKISAPMTSWSARTGSDGVGKFESLPPAICFVKTVREGYLDTRGMGQIVLVKDGATVEVRVKLIRAQLTPDTKLEGRVLDEDGGPLPGVLVHSDWVAATTDKDGRYRLERVLSGPHMLDFRVPAELRRKLLHRDEQTGEVLGYPAVEYYPGVPDGASAQLIQVAGGMDLRGYDVRLRRIQLVDFSGQLLEHPDEPLAGATIELQTAGNVPQYDESLVPREAGDDGRFSFELLPPGNYVLLVYRGIHGTGLPYMAPIEVGRNGVRDKPILVPKNQTIRGVLRVKDNAEWSGDVQVAVVTDQKGVTMRDIKIRRSGDFVLEDVPPGEWRIGAFATVTRTSDRRKLLITGAHYGAMNPIIAPISVAESGNPVLELELSADSGRIAVNLSGAENGTLRVERAGATRYYYNSPFARPDPNGSYVTDDLAPGVYDVSLFPYRSIQVEVKAGETTHVELPSVSVKQ